MCRHDTPCHSSTQRLHSQHLCPQVKHIKSQQTKFGTVLVVETVPQPQRLLLGFQINPIEKLNELLQQTASLLQLNHSKPVFGIRVDHIIDPDIIEEPEEEASITE
jgi:hypothetical protein